LFAVFDIALVKYCTHTIALYAVLSPVKTLAVHVYSGNLSRFMFLFIYLVFLMDFISL